MSLNVFLVVVLSSLFQAWWNFHLKKVDVDKAAFLVVGWLSFGLIAAPIGWWFLDVPFQWSWLPFILATGISQGLYLIVLCWAYTIADISVVFPIARGSSIVLTTMVLMAIGPFGVSLFGVVGLFGVVFGAGCLGSVEFRNRDNRKGILLALLLGMIVTSYSVIDSFGAQNIPIVFYVAIMNLTAPVFALPFLYSSRKKQIREVLRHYKLMAFLVSLAGSAGYLIVIWAFTHAPAPYVLALREVSIIFAATLGYVFLNERMYLKKVVGILFILLGVLFLKLA